MPCLILHVFKRHSMSQSSQIAVAIAKTVLRYCSRICLVFAAVFVLVSIDEALTVLSLRHLCLWTSMSTKLADSYVPHAHSRFSFSLDLTDLAFLFKSFLKAAMTDAIAYRATEKPVMSAVSKTMNFIAKAMSGIISSLSLRQYTSYILVCLFQHLSAVSCICHMVLT